jgi:hypothetical protein
MGRTTHPYKGAAGGEGVIGFMKLSKAEKQGEGKGQNLIFIPKSNKRVAKGSSANG